MHLSQMAKQQQTIIGRKIRYAPAAALQFALLCAVHCCADSAVQCGGGVGQCSSGHCAVLEPVLLTAILHQPGPARCASPSNSLLTKDCARQGQTGSEEKRNQGETEFSGYTVFQRLCWVYARFTSNVEDAAMMRQIPPPFPP